MSRRKYVDINRVIYNAATLSNPIAYECFFYGDCGDIAGANAVVNEIDAVKDRLPDGIDLMDLPKMYCGNKRTKIYGRATCSASEGHQILRSDAPNRVIFKDEDEAKKLGYRPCKKCLCGEE